MIATKEEERKALEKIRKIVETLGENSYIRAAFEGVFEIAESNIADDFLSSAQWYIDEYRKACGEIRELKEAYRKERQENADKVKNLEEALEREQEWKPYEDTDNISQENYDHLADDTSTKHMTDDEAKDLISQWFGFNREKIKIVRTAKIYEINRHKRLRTVGTVVRDPLYNATDWNYIRFDCCGRAYEMYNDELKTFYD